MYEKYELLSLNILMIEKLDPMNTFLKQVLMIVNES